MTTSTTQAGFHASRKPLQPHGVPNAARRCVWCTLILTTAWLAPGAATAEAGAGTDLWLQAAKLTPSVGVAQVALALSDDTAVIGENAASPRGNPFQGAAFVFVREGDTWTQQAPLIASDGARLDSFGQSVALAGDTILVGAPNVQVGGNPGQGAVYVFTRIGDVWTEQAKLTASDGAASDIFGWSVALSNDTAVVGAFGADVDGAEDQGAAYVFTRTGESWNEQAKLTAADGAAGDLLGESVGLSGDTALVGGSQIAVDGNPFQGAAYVFTRSGEVWAEQAKLTAADGSDGDTFGVSVSLTGETAVVGALGADIDGAVDQGAAYVFTRTGESWNEQAKLVATDGAENALFGVSVAASGDTALVGAEDTQVGGNESQGAGYVFARSGEDWSEQAKLTASDGSAGDELGNPVALAGDTALLGAPGRGEIDMFVNRPPGFAAVRGTVRSLGHCGASNAPLSGATVEIVGAESTTTLQTNADGLFQTFLPDTESPLTVTVTANDHQPLSVFGIELSGGDTVVQDFDLMLDAPCATAEPTSFSLQLPPDQSITETLTFGNADGAADLAWSITTAVPSGASMAGGVVSCDATEPGIIVHDDGTIENGYSAVPSFADQVIYADRLVPTFYPASITSLCVAFLSAGPTDLDFELVVFDDDGPDGGPGTELGALPAFVTGIPDSPPLPPFPLVWFGFDLSSLDISIDSGSVFVGVRWAPSDPNVFIASDESPGNPVGFADGYWWNNTDSAWAPIEDGFGLYRSLFIRAVEGGSGCDEPTTIPWLSVDPTSGSVPPGGSGEVVVSLDTTGLSPGEYQANLCVASNDPLRSLIVVPIYLTVTLGGTPELAFDPSIFDFGEVEVGTPGPSGFLTLLNTGDGEATGLSFSGLPDSGFEANTGSCGDTLPAGGGCMVVVAFNPTEPGPAAAALQAASAEGASADLALAGTGIGGGGFTPLALEVDPDPFFADGNGVFEPGEVVEVAPAWRNDDSAGVSLTGAASAYHGPDGANYVPLLGNADYDLVDTGQTASCLEATGVCYWLGVNDPASRPATHWEASFDETLDDADGTTKTWALHIGDSFTDVPRSSPFYEAVETLLHHGVTGGCTGIEYCPGGVNTRGQMAVFLLKAAEGGDYTPPACVEGEELFDDVPADSSLCPWIQDLAEHGVTSGCGGGNFCPGDTVTRSQMAIFLLKAAEGSGYTPPPCAGEFGDVPCSSPFAAWIEELAARGITSGCGGSNYCPAAPVTRAQMAVFVTRTFGLTLYGP